MITESRDMKDILIKQVDDLCRKRAEQNCKHIIQLNTSNKILLGVSQGIGNAILTTPLIKALTSMKMKVDILTEGLIRGAEKIFSGMDNVKLLTADQIEGRIYLLGLQTMWPYQGLEKYVAQLRFAPKIDDCWKAGIAAHEVEINMALAYSLKYTGEIPDTYCHFTPMTSLATVTGKKVGIHICRKYNHQFHANRQLRNPLELGEMLRGEGYVVYILGHENAVTQEDMDKHPNFIFECDIELSQTAGIIKDMDCMVNEDSGIMHVTAAMDIPQVAVFGPTSDIKNKPWSDKAVVIRRELPCVPCQYTERATNCSRNDCMDIDHSYIVNQVNAQIEKYSKPE